MSNRNLATAQIRFVGTVIDELTRRGTMAPSALYEALFSNLHAGGPEALFAGKQNVIEGIFERWEDLQPESLVAAG